MDDTTQPRSALDAMSSFAQQLNRFVASGQTEVPSPAYAKPTLQQHINESEEEHRKRVLLAYRNFVEPQDRDTADDEEQLVVAFRLWQAVLELNRTTGNRETLIKDFAISTPALRRPRYLSGGDFVYLQCWFMYESGCADAVPLLVRTGQGTRLEFVSPAECTFAPRDKEIKELVFREFYAGRQA